MKKPSLIYKLLVTAVAVFFSLSFSFGQTQLYSYQSGNWNDYNIWTLDPSGTLFTNPSGIVPSPADRVKINTGHNVTMASNAVTVSSLTVEGTLDLAATAGHTFTSLSGMGRIRITNADVFPATSTNTFFSSDQGTVEYYGNSFTLTGARNVYNLEVNMSSGQTLTLMGTPYNIAGNLTIKQGTFQINDNTSIIQKVLTVQKDITVKPGSSFTVGTGNTLNGSVDETATGAMQFFVAHNSVYCFGNLTNDGTIRFTNQAAPVYNAFTATGAVSLFMKGASDNTLTCNGTTDLYNLIIDKGQINKLTLYSSAIGNFRLFGPNGLYDFATGGGFTQENPELRKPLWIRNGTLELTGYLFIPSLTEGGGDYYIPSNGTLWLNGASVTVSGTDRTNPGTSVGGVQGTGVDVSNGGAQSFSIFGNLQVSKGLFSTGSHGIVLWYQAGIFGGIKVEGGQCDINGIRTANGSTAGKFSFTQTGGLIRFLGDNGNQTMENYASLCLRGTDCSYSVSGGTMEFYDGQSGVNDAGTSTGGIIRIESNPANINVTGGTTKIIRNASTGNNYSIYTTAPFYNLELTGSSANSLSAGINSAVTVLNNLTINDFSTLDVTANNNNLSIGGNLSVGNTTTTNNAVYNARSNNTIFTGNQNSIITIANTVNAVPLTFYNLSIDKTPTSSLATAWSVTLNSPGRTETSGAAVNHLITISNDLSINEGKWNNYRYKTQVQRHITNYGTILSDVTNPGRITVENGSVQHRLTGSTSSVNSFGNIELNDGDGARLYSSLGSETFYLTDGILDINTYNLNVTGIIGSTYSTTKMILSYGSPSSQGVTLTISVSGNYSNQNIVVPVGVGGTYAGDGTIAGPKYTPLTINLNGNTGAGPYTGTVNVRPVDEYHPTSGPSKVQDLVPFYWKTEVTGNLQDATAAAVNYSFLSSYGFDYGSGKKECYYRTADWTEDDNASNPLVFSGTGFETTDYTAGKRNAFRTPKILYSRQSGNWNTLATWSTLGHGTTSAPTVLNSYDVYQIGGSGGVNHQVTVTAGNTIASKVIIQSKAVTGISNDPPPSLIINSGLSGNDFNLITGGGRLVMNDGTLPNGDYLDFCYNDTSIFEFSGGNYSLPAGLTVYPNLWISGAAGSNKTLPDANIIVRKNLIISDRTNNDVRLTLANTANGNITVNDSLVLDNQSKLIYQNSGIARIVTVLKNINCINGGVSEVNSIEVATGGTSNLTHQLVVQGDIRTGASTMNLFSANSVIDLVLNGETDSRIYNYAGSMSLNRLIINKSASTLRATVDKSFSVNAATNTPDKPLSLQQGILRINNASVNLVLSSGGGDYTIPASGSIILDQGSLSIRGNNTGITLNGLLEINGGSVSVYNATNTNNYIQYSSTGDARINISGGSLRVGSQIRRFTSTSGGALTYNQTGGTVEVGYSDAPVANRGVLEVVNTGSSFTLTGGTMTIFRGQTGATVPSLYIEPDLSNIGPGMTINIGGGTGSPQIGIFSSVPLPNIAIIGTGTPTVKMWNGPLTIGHNLTINTGATFDANGLQLNISGNFINNGTYIHNNNTVIFEGVSSQEITGSTTFFNLTKSTSGILNVNSNIQISNNLRLEDGTITDNGNTIKVLRDVYNTGTITYGGVINSAVQLGLHMNGTISQSVEGSGTFGKLTIDNPQGVFLPLGTSITVTNALRLNQGLLDIQGNLLVLSLNCLIEGSGFNPTRMIQTNISFTDNGIKKYFSSGSQVFTYPIGCNGKYTPLTFNITANDNSTGSITVKAANEIHPGITDDAESSCQLNDRENVLQYYWILNSNGITGFSGTASMTGLLSDIRVNNACSLTSSEYITAKLLAGSTTWSKFSAEKFTESSCQLDFDFNSTDDNGISGDYLAGLEVAIPNSVTVYQTISSGNWTNGAIWQTIPSGGPVPAGGPRGSVVIINPAHIVDVTSNANVFSYKTTIDGTLNLNATNQHRLGYVFGTGILKMTNNSTLPAGDYSGTNGFITSAGGTLEFAGNTDYSVLSTISTLNNVTFSGSGNRYLPNNNLLIFGNVVIAGPVLTNGFDADIEIRKDFVMTSGRFISKVNSGNPVVKLTGSNAQSVTGNFTSANNSAFYNFEVTKTMNSVTLGSSIEILNHLQLTSGLINTTTSNLLIVKNQLSTAVTGGSASSFVNGPLRKKIDNGDDFNFPVGKGTRYGIVSVLSVQSTVSDYYWTAEYFNTGHPDLTTSPVTFTKSSTEYWRLNSPVNGYTAKVKLRWDAQSDITPLTTAIADIRAAEYNGTDWIAKISDLAVGDNNNGTVQTTLPTAINNATNPQYYTLGSISTVKPTITLGTNPQVCVGSASAGLPYTSTTGNPNQYIVDYNAAANAAGFADILTWTSLPVTPVTLNVPVAAAVGTYNATIQVRSSGTPANISLSVPFAITLSPLPNAIIGATSLCAGSVTTLSNTTPGGTWSSSNPVVATISQLGVVTTLSAGTSVIGYTVAGCAATVTITVNPVPFATISYGGSPWFITAGIQNVTLTGTAGGTYSAPAGLSINSTTGTITPSTSTAGTYVVTYTIAASGGCSIVTATTTVTIVSGLIWTGAVSTDWNSAGNWSFGAVPVSTTLVTIPDVANKPVISTGATATVNNLTINAGSSLTVSGNTIQISGTIVNNGTFTAVNGRVEMNGSDAQVIGAGIFAGNTIRDLTISNSAGVTLAGPLNITGIVTISSGSLNSAGNLTLLSSAAGTALISGSGTGAVSGNVTMQRYLPSVFGYRYFSSPFQAATVNEFADDMVLDYFTFFRYDESRTSSGWVDYDDPSTNPLIPLQGYAVNLGDIDTPNTIDLTGTVNNGNFSVTLYNHDNIYTKGFNLIGNPYPSPIDWNAPAGWTKTGVDNALYYFKASNTDQYGGTYSTYINGISSDGIVNNIIPSMQGFFVHVSDGVFPVTGTLALNNSVRITNLNHPFAKSASYPVPMLRLRAGFDGDTASTDPAIIYFDENSTDGFDSQLDALKLLNTDFSVANLYTITPEGKKLSISALPPTTGNFRQIPLGLKLNREGTVVFKISEIDASLAGMRIYLTDKVSGTEQDLLPDKVYSLSLGAGEYNDRFFLNFSNETAGTDGTGTNDNDGTGTNDSNGSGTTDNNGTGTNDSNGTGTNDNNGTGTNDNNENDSDENLATGSANDILQNDLFTIYSSHGKLKAEINLLEGKGVLKIYDLTGQVLFLTTIYQKGHYEFEPGFKEGIYIISYTSGSKMINKKIYIEN